MKIQIFSNEEEAAIKAAESIAAEARQCVQTRGRFTFAVSGGRSPWLMLKALTRQDVPWNQVHIVQVDERIAPPGDPDRNLTHVRESLANSPLRAGQIHAMPVEASDLAGAAKDYYALLQDIAGHPPVLDLVHLGLGPDGHTASLVPGDPDLDIKDADVALSSVYQGRRRMTLTYSIINRARRVLWLVTGKEKTAPLTRLLAGDRSVPAGRVNQERAVVFADGAAAPDLETNDTEHLPMRIGVATDHGGFALKDDLIGRLRAAGHEVTDFGAHELTPDDDYPDFVIPLAHAVAAKEVDRGIAICGSGVGASVCANKIPGIRAALIHDHFSARQGVEDDHMNIICLGGRTEGPEVAWDLVQTFLSAQGSTAERHLRRLSKVAALEEHHQYSESKVKS